MAAGRSRAGSSAGSTSRTHLHGVYLRPAAPAVRAGRPRNRAWWRYMRARPGEGRRPVTFPRALARYTRGAVNTVTLRLAGHLAFADLEHIGRKAGTVRHTPGARVPVREHRDRRPELRAPAGLVPEHPSGRHLPDAPGRRADHPRRASARPRSPGRHRSALAGQEAARRLCAARTDLPGPRQWHRRCVRPRIPGFSPGGLGWAPSIPRGRRCPYDRREVRGRRLPLHGGQSLSPRCRYPSRGVRVTRHHQGFTGIRPSSLPLTCDPGTDTGALGLSPELHTPASRTRRRMSGRGQVPNTDPKSHIRHHRTSTTDLLTTSDLTSQPRHPIVQLAVSTSNGAPYRSRRTRSATPTIDPATTRKDPAPARKPAGVMIYPPNLTAISPWRHQGWADYAARARRRPPVSPRGPVMTSCSP